MTLTEIEERFAKLERRFALLKAENDANRWFTTALIGSHPNLELLLEMVHGAIQRLHEQAGSEGLSPFAAHVVKRLEGVVAAIHKAMSAQAARSAREAAPQEHRAGLTQMNAPIRTGRSSSDELDPEQER
ncbi:TPA: hypothetical protein RNS66_000967 [Stenotrophomonas maltophilia]|nr:hypothetical protein [Stenotrophomonas maltophilia]HDX0938784.1 hypothetical protein [Stenotrophomonas maltophilia]